MTNPSQLFIVEDTVDTRLDRYLKRQIPGLHQGLLEKLLRLGKIRVNDHKVKANARLNNGDVVTVLVSIEEQLTPRLPVREETKEEPSFVPGEKDWFLSLIIWEDEDLLVLNKPHGLAVQGGTKTERHVDYYLSALSNERRCRYRLTHRIDRDTSGVLLVAKTQTMATYLTDAFKNGNIHKTYWAIVVDHPRPGIGKINAPLIKSGGIGREKMAVDYENGKPATTIYRTVRKLIHRNYPELTWLELEPETGRTHQIRVHCQHLGTPIIGDGKYGGKTATDVTRVMHLHARTVAFRDPHGNRFSFSADPAEHFVETLQYYNVAWDKI